ncbi:MAG: hypothetical protein Q9175_003638 [Cornicularia normoerica]
MASNILSKFLPPAAGEVSLYETWRQHDELSDQSDLEERAGMILDEENLGTGFRDYELDDALANATTNQAVPPRIRNSSRQSQGTSARKAQSRTRTPHAVGRVNIDDSDDEVPQSLLIEDDQDPSPLSRAGQNRVMPPPVSGPSSRATRAKWQATQEQQRLHQEPVFPPIQGKGGSRRGHPLGMVDRKDQAMWMWANVENLDNFLKDVYDYYIGNGIWCILLNRMLNLLTLAFVVAFSTFLGSCINYKVIPDSKKMSQILVSQCTKNMSAPANLLIWLFAFFWICKLFQYCYDFRHLRHMQDFYRCLLEISDTDIQTVSWQEIVKRLMLLRDSNPVTAAAVKDKHRRFLGSQSKQRMDAHDIANRLMRRENYMIALINKDILDLTLPLPLLRNRQFFSKTLEWNLSLCILDFVFNEQGQVRPLFLKDIRRRALSDKLRQRFIFAGFMNLFCAPFLVIFFMLYYFFRYFNEYQRNPSQIGSRQYTPLAEWQFREFNELWHLFQRRVNMSYPFASRYLEQFPKDKTIQISRFVAFVTGALASVLALASVIDPELFLAFEITPERTVLFYLGVFGTVWAVARGIVPEENHVFDPEYALTNVAEYTHYLPNHWRDRLHTNEVRAEFATLYKMKLVIFLEEILSIIITPLILWFSLPKCSDRLIDFFREFTVHVDGLGYVCSFAVFDFKKGGNNTAPSDGETAQDLREEYYSTKDGKMLASYYGFIDNYVTNQRPGAPFLHPTTRSSFHVPPVFPGLTSPTLAAEVHGPALSRPARADRHKRAHARPALPGVMEGLQLVPQRTPRFAPTGGHASPMASILLDPQHQPARTGPRTQRKFDAHSRLRTSTKPLQDPLEDEEEALLANDGRSGADGSEGGADDSNLGESWKTTRAGTLDENGEEDVQATSDERGPGGILGLVYQFSKAQTEGRGTGVSI